MFANVEREREGERLVQACQSKHCIGGSTSREGCVCVCVCVCVYFLNVVILYVFFFYSGDSSTLGTRLGISKFCVDLCKKI